MIKPSKRLAALGLAWLIGMAEAAPLNSEGSALFAEHGPVRLCVDPDWKPFEFIDAENRRLAAWVEQPADERLIRAYVSPSVEAVFGYRAEEIVGHTFFDDLHPEPGREAFKQMGYEVLARKERQNPAGAGFSVSSGPPLRAGAISPCGSPTPSALRSWSRG
ncbi:MAG: PAS domain S-box protein [Pseudomonadota bacterium]